MQYPRIMFHVVKKCKFLHLNNIRQQQRLHSCYTHKIPSVSTIPSFIGALKYSNDSTSVCWNCNYIHKCDLFCSQCNALQETLQNLNYFEMMGVEQNYNISNDVIHKKYTNFQKLLHPDKFYNKSEKEKVISENLSSLVSKAYTTLQDPLKRGIYMLQLNNTTIPEGTTSANMDFLAEVMERNMEIEEASNDKTKLIKIIQQNKELLNALSKEIGNAFHQKDIDKAKDALIRMKYYVSIDNRLKKHKLDLGIID